MLVADSDEVTRSAALATPTIEEIETLTLRIARRVGAQAERLAEAEGEVGAGPAEIVGSVRRAIAGVDRADP